MTKPLSAIPLLVATLYGLSAGAIAAVVLWVMNHLSDVLWHHDFGSNPAYIFGIIMVGGVLIALLRHVMQGRDPDLAGQIEEAAKADGPDHKDIVLLGAMAIVAVAFGGAIGPEAGILAIVAEMSALVSLAIARSKDQQKLIAEVGVAAALGGLYASPPGGALIPNEDEGPEGEDTGNDVPQHKPRDALRPLLFLAGLMGFIGFLVTASWILGGEGMRVTLPAFDQSAILPAMAHSILPAFFGGLMGLLFVTLAPWLQHQLGRLGGVIPQTLAGTLLFAALAAIWPIARFSGHHELLEMSHWAMNNTPAAAIGLALLKITALTLCIASGWKGGAIFPLLFAGAAAGAAMLPFIPPELATAAFIAAMASAATIGMGKPMAAMLVVALLIAPFAAGPLMVGAIIGYGLSRLGPKPVMH